MKTILIASLLAAAALGVIQGRRSAQHTQSILTARIVRTNTLASPAKTLAGKSPGVASVVLPADPWKAIEANKYRDAIAWLRAAGCPEETIRDLFFLELSQQAYSQYGSWLSQYYATMKWWHEPEGFNLASEEQLQTRHLRATRNNQMYALFGLTDDECMSQFGLGLELTWIERDKKKRFLDIEDQFQEEQNRIKEYKHTLTSEEKARLNSLEKEHRAALNSLLTVEELDTYDARYSKGAQYVRSQMPPAQSEAEFRLMAQLANQADLSEPSGIPTSFGDEALAEKKAAEDAKKALVAKIQKTIGPEATAKQQAAVQTIQDEKDAKELEEAVDKALANAQTLNIDRESVKQLFLRLKQMDAEVNAKLDAINSDAGLTAKQRDQKIQEEIESTIRKTAVEIMGEKGNDFVAKMMEAEKKR